MDSKPEVDPPDMPSNGVTSPDDAVAAQVRPKELDMAEDENGGSDVLIEMKETCPLTPVSRLSRLNCVRIFFHHVHCTRTCRFS